MISPREDGGLDLNRIDAGGRQHGGLHLRRHASGAHARARTGDEDAHEVVRSCDALDQLRARVVRGRRVQSVDVREEHQGVGLDHLGDQGGQAVVIAEAQLPGGHGVGLVEDRDDAEA